MNKALGKCLNSFLSICLAIGFSLAATPIAQAADDCLPEFTLVGEACERTYNYCDGAKSYTVPSGLGEFEIELFGAAGGSGGLDGGTCARSFGGPDGYVLIQNTDLSSKTLSIYPGEKGADGASNRNASGGGLGGNSSLGDAYSGGQGGNAGSVGTSGGGGGGGAGFTVSVESRCLLGLCS